jgi:hypothetical protein
MTIISFEYHFFHHTARVITQQPRRYLCRRVNAGEIMMTLTMKKESLTSIVPAMLCWFHVVQHLPEEQEWSPVQNRRLVVNGKISSIMSNNDTGYEHALMQK